MVLMEGNLKVSHLFGLPLQMATAEIRQLPDAGDIVVATIKEITGHGAYVILDEYNGMTGFLHISEIATGWIRNIERYVKPKQKAVLKVIRVDKARAEVDLSLKQVSGEERKSKLIEVKKTEKASAFMEIIKVKAQVNDSQIKEIEDKILQKYDYVYDVFETAARKGIDAIQNLDLPETVIKAIEEESSKIQIPRVEIRGILEISLKKSDGIEVIKNILSAAETSKSNAHINISYIAAPRYRIVVSADNFKVAEKALNNIVEKIRNAIEKQRGTFGYIRQESKKSHQG
jgi:translation initiation factor 2 subunit 1